MTSELARLLIRDGLAFDVRAYVLFTAVHEAGHAVAGLATGDFWMGEAVLTVYPGAPADAYTDVGWGEVRTQLVFLPGGELAQLRWLREQGLWTPIRGRATRNAAHHDRAALRSLGFDWRARHAAAQEAEAHLARHWPAVLDVAGRLAAAGRISGATVCDVMNDHLRNRARALSETATLPGTSDAVYAQLAQDAARIAAQSRQRATQALAAPNTAQPPEHAQHPEQTQHLRIGLDRPGTPHR
jgi:hypothetical protein